MLHTYIGGIIMKQTEKTQGIESLRKEIQELVRSAPQDILEEVHSLLKPKSME